MFFQAVTAGAILFAGAQIIINRKQLHLSTITKCIDSFRALGGIKRDTTDLEIIKEYVDIVNEELFYFQHKYIPKEVSKEWIDGMIDYLPITNTKFDILNQEHCIEYLANNRKDFLRDYPRIQNAFEVRGKYNFRLIYSVDEKERLMRVEERKKLITEILKNIKRFDWYD